MLVVLVIGGTLEKIHMRGWNSLVYPGTNEDATATSQIIKRFTNAHHHTVMCPLVPFFRDGPDVSLFDRSRIADWCFKLSPFSRCVIVHDIEQMIETAEYLASKISTPPRGTIVLTGSLQPHGFTDSDAEFNLGGAVTAAKILPPGVYIAMHGEVFPWNECRKNPETGVFEPIAYFDVGA